MRIVADTNVLVSALIFPGGAPETVYRLALEDRLQLVTSTPLLTELGRVLTAKFDWDSEAAEETLAGLIRLAEVVEPRQRFTEIGADPDDNRVLEAAHEGHPDTIVSGDRHLLELGSWQGIPIEAPASFLERF